jgi:undecaprenyl diphosphate synthase
MKDVKELHIILRGRVQGVSMRKNLSVHAKVLGLQGYVENLPDGTVSVVAQGEESTLQELLNWAQTGEFPAKVKGMTYEWVEPGKKYEEFSIRKNDNFIKDQANSFSNLGKEIIGAKKEGRVPQHVVIIADGNRRWARSKGWKPWVGHRRGGDYNRIKGLFEECRDIGIKYASIWVWSTENWDRSEEEREEIFNIFRKWADKALKDFNKEGIRFRHIGRKDRLPGDIVEKLTELEEKTKTNSKLNAQMCMDYGGRDEIVRAVNSIISSGIQEVTEDKFSRFLDTADIPDPDLVIRTSGENRTSGIMPWQATYAELYFTQVPFPEFGAEELRRAVVEYSHRTRRFGGSVKEDLKNVDESKLVEPDEEEAGEKDV